MNKKNYIVKAFIKTLDVDFPERKEELYSAFEKRLEELLKENSNESKEKKYHLEKQILPGIAAYETLQKAMPKEKALETVHSYVEERAHKLRKSFDKLMKIPGLYRIVPKIFTKGTRKMFGTAAGFDAVEIKTDDGVWRIDMTKCPYHDTCKKYGCGELCPSFCDSDDITYSNLHKNLLWERSKTLGRGDDRCDFCLKRVDK